MANTIIQIKRSQSAALPTSLNYGELAYSFQSGKLAIGNATNGVVVIGGNTYTQMLDAATSVNTGGTIVKRDASGNFYGQLFGNANTATTLQNGRNFSISGGDITAGTQGFDGSASIVLNASLNTVSGLTAGYYGGTTAIPIVQVAANGRIMSISNTTVSTSFTVSGNTGSGTQAGGGTLTVQGANASGVNTTVTGSGGNETITINTDNTIMRSNTSAVGGQTIGTDLYVSGNLVVTGTQTYVNTATIQTTDSLIELAANNVVGDVIDIGFYGLYNNGSANVATGLIRDAGNKAYYLFSGVSSSAITSNTIANNLFTASNTATLYANLMANTANAVTANITSATIGTLTLTNALAVGQGGTGTTTFNAGQIIVGNGTGALQPLANVGTAGTYGSSSYHPVITTDAYGRVSGVSNTQIQIDTSQITSGTLPVTRGGTGVTVSTGTSYVVLNTSPIITTPTLSGTVTGGTFSGGTWSGNAIDISHGGTNNNSYTTNQIVYYNGTSITSLANTGTAGIYGNSAYIPVVTTDGFGRISGVTNTAIAISASQVTSGSLAIAQGGTNSNAGNFTNNTLTYYNGTGIVSLANVTFTATGTGATNNTITSVTVDNFGRTSALTYSAIAGLTVGQGGTGISTATTNGIVFGNGTAALGVTAAAGTSDQTWTNQILTVNNSGTPIWSSALDGGSF